MQSAEELIPLRSLQNILMAKDTKGNVTVKLKKMKRRKRGESNKCSDCKEVFSNLKSYDQHHCRGSGAYTCNFCDRSYNHFKRLVNHIYTHLDCTRHKEYTCDVCRKTSKKLSTLQIHILGVHHNIEHRCQKCDKRFPSKIDLNNHPCKEQPVVQCLHCGDFFSTKQFKTHSKIHQLNAAFKCKYCSGKFVTQLKYDVHVSKMNCSKAAQSDWLDQFDPTTCRECKRCFQSEKELICHFKFYHKGLTHLCCYCEMQLETFQDLKTHTDLHFSRTISCDLCGKQYTSKEGYRKHRIKHNGTDFKCQFCYKQFLSEKRFSAHLRKCKRNPENGNLSDQGLKSSRQLKWESRIIVKKVRGVDVSISDVNISSDAQIFEIEKEASPLSDRSGWFDAYYRTGEDDLKFGILSEEKPDTMDDPPCDDPPPPPFPSDESDSSNSSGDEVEEKIDFNPKLCRICDTVFSQEYELIHHFIKIHPGAVPHKCTHCDVEAPLFAQLKEHLKIHGIGLGVHHCGNCSKTFRSESRLRVHYAKCTGTDTGRPLIETCKRCGKTYQTKCGYKRHKKLCKNEKRVKEVKIPEPDPSDTDEDFRDPEPELHENLIKPLELREPTPPPPTPPPAPSPPALLKVEEVKDEFKMAPKEAPKDSFPCRLCPSSFQFERGIVMHFKAEHPNEKPLMCHVCGVKLADKLKEHLKTHGIGEEFVCQLCGKQFNQKFMSKIHEMWHQGIEYKCSNCKQKFLNQEKMEKHIGEGRCQNRLSLMRLPCDICGKSYRSKFGLNSHYMIHTPKDLRPVKNKMNCEFCGKWFESNNGLTRHRRIHTGEKPYCCKSCPRAFAQESNCKAHERTHSGEARPRKKKVQITQAPDLPLSAFGANRAAHVFTTFGPPPQIDQLRPLF